MWVSGVKLRLLVVGIFAIPIISPALYCLSFPFQCYYLGASKDSATKILGEVTRPLSVHVPIVKICERLKKMNSQICKLNYGTRDFSMCRWALKHWAMLSKKPALEGRNSPLTDRLLSWWMVLLCQLSSCKGREINKLIITQYHICVSGKFLKMNKGATYGGLWRHESMCSMAGGLWSCNVTAFSFWVCLSFFQLLLLGTGLVSSNQVLHDDTAHQGCLK